MMFAAKVWLQTYIESLRVRCTYNSDLWLFMRNTFHIKSGREIEWKNDLCFFSSYNKADLHRKTSSCKSLVVNDHGTEITKNLW